MNRNITIRFAEAEDAGLLAALGRETFHDAFAGHPLMPAENLKLYLDAAFTVGQMTIELNDPQTIFLLAEVDGEAGAYAKLESGAGWEGVIAENPVKLKRLYSKQKFIGGGIGKSLLERCLEEAANRHHDVIWLTVWKHNRRAYDFYRKWNFEYCGTFDFHLGKMIFIDDLMARPIRLSRSA